MPYLALAAYRYRDFDTMKAEYLVPGLLGFVFVMCEAAAPLLRWCRDNPMVARILLAWSGALIALCVVDVGILIDRLA